MHARSVDSLNAATARSGAPLRGGAPAWLALRPATTSSAPARRSATACGAHRFSEPHARRAAQVRALPAHGLVQVARRAEPHLAPHGGGEAARRDRDHRRQPRAGRRVRRGRRRASTRSSSCGTAPRSRRSPRLAATARTSTSRRATRRRRSSGSHELIEETGRTLVHPFDDPLVIAGAGTVGLEIEEDAPDADAVIVAVGGGGLVSGIQTAIGHRTRVIAVEPEPSPALHAGLEHGEPTPVEPTLDRGRPQRTVRGPAAARDLPRPRARARHRGGDRARVPLPLRARQARRASRPARPRPRRCSPARCRPNDPSARRRAATSPAKPPLLSWPGHEGRDPSRVRPLDRALLVRELVRDPFDEAGAARRDLLAVPPVLHGQAEARRHGRPRRALPAAAREGRARTAFAARSPMAQAIGGQAVLEGVMMRGPRNWAVAVRKPDGEIAHVARRSTRSPHATGRCASRSCAASSRSARPSRSASARSRSRRTTPPRRRPRATASRPRSAAGRSSSPSPSRSASP